MFVHIWYNPENHKIINFFHYFHSVTIYLITFATSTVYSIKWKNKQSLGRCERDHSLIQRIIPAFHWVTKKTHNKFRVSGFHCTKNKTWTSEIWTTNVIHSTTILTQTIHLLREEYSWLCHEENRFTTSTCNSTLWFASTCLTYPW